MRAFDAIWLCSAASCMIFASSAQAQESENMQPTPSGNEEIVVTGTILRGIAPVGTNVVNVGSEEIKASGATNTNQVLARIPQITTAFNATPTLPVSDPGTSIVRPNLRNLAVAAGGTTTLVLLDGHRVVNAGVLLTSVNPDVIPPAVIERVDVIPDGGSATYGSDAVGGVINLITRRRFDGAEINARYGFADNYHVFSADMTVGKDWGSGSAYISYAYTNHDEIFGRDRDFMRQVTPNLGRCAPGTVLVNRGGTITSYALPDRVAGTSITCDTTDNTTLWPAETRHSVFASLTQELSDSITLDVRGFYTHQLTTAYVDLNSGTEGSITSANPYYVPIAPNDPGTQTVRFSYSSIFSGARVNTLDQFGITPTITANLGGGWQARLMGNYGRSKLVYTLPNIDGTAQSNALAATTTAAALNPYNPGASSTAVLASIFRQEVDTGRQTMANARAIVDGSPFSLPGGEVRLALGIDDVTPWFPPARIRARQLCCA